MSSDSSEEAELHDGNSLYATAFYVSCVFTAGVVLYGRKLNQDNQTELPSEAFKRFQMTYLGVRTSGSARAATRRCPCSRRGRRVCCRCLRHLCHRSSYWNPHGTAPAAPTHQRSYRIDTSLRRSTTSWSPATGCRARTCTRCMTRTDSPSLTSRCFSWLVCCSRAPLIHHRHRRHHTHAPIR